jgi:hypothetical protein
LASDGFGGIVFKLTSINGYAGTIGVANCTPTSPPAGAKLPICGGGSTTSPRYTLTANATMNGSITLSPYGDTVPGTVTMVTHTGHGEAAAWALAGVLLLGLGFRRRAARWLTLTLFAVGTLASLAGICACGGNSNAMTPGTYPYTLMAADINTGTSVSTTVNVTVP